MKQEKPAQVALLAFNGGDSQLAGDLQRALTDAGWTIGGSGTTTSASSTPIGVQIVLENEMMLTASVRLLFEGLKKIGLEPTIVYSAGGIPGLPTIHVGSNPNENAFHEIQE